MIDRAVQVYIDKIHWQPLPLFPLDNLSSRVLGWPQHLLLNLLSITTRFSSEILPGWTTHDRQRCRTKARRELMNCIEADAERLTTLQSLCLCILEELSGKTAFHLKS